MQRELLCTYSGTPHDPEDLVLDDVKWNFENKTHDKQ